MQNSPFHSPEPAFNAACALSVLLAYLTSVALMPASGFVHLAWGFVAVFFGLARGTSSVVPVINAFFLLALLRFVPDLLAPWPLLEKAADFIVGLWLANFLAHFVSVPRLVRRMFVFQSDTA